MKPLHIKILERPGGESTAVALLLIVSLSACSTEVSGPQVPQAVPDSTQPIHYQSPPPPGKLPWPIHNPAFSVAEYTEMMNKKLFIINNFGLYQGGNSEASTYIHDGLDVVVPSNGTKMFAVDSGYVKDIDNRIEYYTTIIIGDTKGSAPGNAWTYTHVNNFQFKVGDFVRRGAYIADVHFQGVPHVHMNRAFLVSGPWSVWENLSFIQPDSYFEFEDSDAPVFEAPFYFFHNETDSLFAGERPVVRGDVDIVVGIREAGAYARSRDESLASQGFGDRLCVSRIEYEIAGPGVGTEKRSSFDFAKLICKYTTDQYLRTLTVYKFRFAVHPEPPPTYDKIFSYYVITNADPVGPPRDVRYEDRAFAWNTAAIKPNGSRFYPDGGYRITVTAWDSHGNSASQSDSVVVANVP